MKLFLFTLLTLIFYFSVGLNLNWIANWLILSLAILLIIFSSGKKFIKQKDRFDDLLFFLGLFLFLIVEPFIAILFSDTFPSIFGFTSNYISNKVGLIISVFCLAYSIGSMIHASKPNLIKSLNFGTYLNKHSKITFLIFFILGLSPYFIYGAGSVFQNLLVNLSGRSSGYVAFATGGLGTENPFIIFSLQFLIPTIILLGVSINAKTSFLKKIVLFISLILLIAVLASGGGRTSLIIPTLTIIFYFFITKKSSFRIPLIIFIFFFINQVFSYQMSNRYGDFDNGYNSFHGYNLNRELTFIAENFGDGMPYTDSSSLYESLIFPMFDLTKIFITNPIPRIFWKNKPYDKSFSIYNKLRTGSSGYGKETNITPTIVGRFYMKYGYIGVFQIGLLLGVLYKYLNNLLIADKTANHLRLLSILLFMMTLFVSFRDLTPGRFYPFLIFLIFYRFNKN